MIKLISLIFIAKIQKFYKFTASTTMANSVEYVRT